MRDILTLRDEARAARLAERVIPADPLADLVEAAERDAAPRVNGLYTVVGTRCACGNLLTFVDRGRRCRQCVRAGL